ncbi:Bifunctional inhibitor/lipid-transfer protein/seed storage 2S albumin superfamily protein, putative isoform 1 [Hibiscus syriacus]|uniref:Bifunctional inhibitor/lipid-transfer protein/seed storage 2S albumin superfamily protein, putative isoform 1 n=1 Tax=Hibiscus syriacus TaxID=106335 RepID=A0A6A2YGF7_HIBSY|nr:Bifunctional inhibitor/lipid-transfer protein/seed storage 2S albumin superfamily protein, putative isoform 1 [Hibiscus syriacus]
MEGVKVLQLLTVLSILSTVSVKGQSTTACSASMISSFTPCLNFITGSSSNGSSPTQDCCGSLKSLISRSMDCARLLIAANVPLSCSRIANLMRFAASGTTLTAPGPVPFLLPPTLPPTAASPLSPESDLTPAAPPIEDEPEPPSVTLNPRNRPVLQPSAGAPNPYLPSVLVTVIGIAIFKFY